MRSRRSAASALGGLGGVVGMVSLSFAAAESYRTIYGASGATARCFGGLTTFVALSAGDSNCASADGARP